MTDVTAFGPPSLATIIDGVDGDIATSMPGADPWLPRSVLAALARAKGGAANEEYFTLRWVYKQLFPQSADWEALVWHGQLKNVFPKLASAASFSVALAGNNGMTAGAGSVVQRSDGAQFTLNADATIADGTATATVTASAPGSAGNTPINSTLSFVAPIPGINSNATVGAAVTTGFDAETKEAFRGRVVLAWQKPAQGGDLDDYVAWAKNVAGVTRAWAFANWMGVGSVGLLFVEDDNPNGIIPIAGDVAAAQAYIDSVRPVTAALYVVAPTSLPLNPSVHISPDNAANRAAVASSLAALVAAEAIPGGSISASGVFYLTHIEEAVETTPGIVDCAVTILVGIAAANVTVGAGQLVQLGAITWV